MRRTNCALCRLHPCVARQRDGTTVSWFAPVAWDHLVRQLWDHPGDPPTPVVLTGSSPRSCQRDREGGDGVSGGPVFEVGEVLRLWLGDEGYRSIERLSEVDRKTARRYVEAAVAVGL